MNHEKQKEQKLWKEQNKTQEIFKKTPQVILL